MSKPLGYLALLGVSALAALTLSACGGGVPGNAVVSVNGKPITTSTFNHWLAVAAGSSAAATPTGQAAKSVVPDPPTYTKCIAHLEATAPKPAKGQLKPTAATLKAQCEQQYTALKQQVLGFLISANWVLGEAEEQGVKVSDTEVKKQFNQVKNQQFPKEADFKKFLATSGQTVSDLLLRVKLDMLSSKIQQKITKNAGKKASEKEISTYYAQHKSQYGQPERRNLLVVLTKTQAQAESA
ncbi:MAG TPA: SurA N-terminal domain-containing protein, partial [Solirubrobacteraceae bacterium]